MRNIYYYNLASKLVRSKIPGTRKGSDRPAYMHSFDVYDILKAAGVKDHVAIAGLLHDVVEDGEVTIYDIFNLFAPEIALLVMLVTHDKTIEDSDLRWQTMIEKIANFKNKDVSSEALCIKTADVMDNLMDSMTLKPHRQAKMWDWKAPFILSLWQRRQKKPKLYHSLKKIVQNKHKYIKTA